MTACPEDPFSLPTGPTSPQGRTIAALAVDNEPEPFWDGLDEEARIARWRHAVGWSTAPSPMEDFT
jgi:hypothetical protein